MKYECLPVRFVMTFLIVSFPLQPALILKLSFIFKRSTILSYLIDFQIWFFILIQRVYVYKRMLIKEYVLIFRFPVYFVCFVLWIISLQTPGNFRKNHDSILMKQKRKQWKLCNLINWLLGSQRQKGQQTNIKVSPDCC